MLNITKTLFVTLPLLFSVNAFSATTSATITTTIKFVGTFPTVSCVEKELTNVKALNTVTNACVSDLQVASVTTDTKESKELVGFNI